MQHWIIAVWQIFTSSCRANVSLHALVINRERPFFTPCWQSTLFLTFPQCSGQLKDSFWLKTPRLPPSTGTQGCSGLSYSAGTGTIMLDSSPSVRSVIIDAAPIPLPPHITLFFYFYFRGSFKSHYSDYTICDLKVQ